MTDAELSFTLNDAEILEFYAYYANILPQSRRWRLWFKLSGIFLALLSIFAFKLYRNTLVVGIIVLIAFIWFFRLSNLLWKYLILLKTEKLLKQQVKAQKKVKVSFKEDYYLVDAQKHHYRDIVKVIPLQKLIVFFCQDNFTFVIPLRVWANEQEMKAFLTAFFKKWHNETNKSRE